MWTTQWILQRFKTRSREVNSVQHKIQNISIKRVKFLVFPLGTKGSACLLLSCQQIVVVLMFLQQQNTANMLLGLAARSTAGLKLLCRSDCLSFGRGWAVRLQTLNWVCTGQRQRLLGLRPSLLAAAAAGSETYRQKYFTSWNTLACKWYHFYLCSADRGHTHILSRCRADVG